MIKLKDFLKIPDEKRTKIKFNMNAADVTKRAWDFLLEDSEEWIIMNAWKTKQTNNNLNHADYLVALAQYYPYGPQYFIFGGLYKVEKKVPEVFNDVGYQLTLMEENSQYIKRLIIKIDKPIGRDAYNRRYETIQEQLNPEVYEVAPSTKLGHFNGYQNVCLKHKELQQIIQHNEPSWREALSYVKGVYVITDLSNGQLYVGSASGNTDGLWQRWSCYAHLSDLTGGNKEFHHILENKGKDYIINHFQYSILEIFDTKTKVEVILERENYWKNVLDSKQHGMNHN
ncbi:GIY-YIG nuclease family protein [Staphylococcus agnetis]|uniref:GIY-YIG nuclease family protein n=1 Tax=Staphylococcus agnetis TaxID=985762 RepID=UPI001431F75F|nr:GIY-YIG nuclease family protein [Staphylococcus agnetis]NJH85967.1 GIY-YIG nuclease family protein [Staphylococcus agnetis]NJI14885.1 GIY-YIG nuclease family protein [Staphylococcus agnetis]